MTDELYFGLNPLYFGSLISTAPHDFSLPSQGVAMPLAEVSAVSESWVASCYGFPVV